MHLKVNKTGKEEEAQAFAPHSTALSWSSSRLTPAFGPAAGQAPGAPRNGTGPCGFVPFVPVIVLHQCASSVGSQLETLAQLVMQVRTMLLLQAPADLDDSLTAVGPDG